MKPKWRVILLLCVLNAAWMIGSWAWIERENWMWITPIALSINFLLLTYDWLISLSRLPARRLEGQDVWGLLKSVHELSELYRVPVPRVELLDTSAALIFTYGRNRHSSRLHISEGTLKLLSARELQAVLTYQIFSIKTSQSVLNFWVAAITDLFFRIGRGAERAIAFVLGWSPPLARAFIRPIMWLMQILLISRNDYVKLDRETGRKLAQPEDLARALWKLEAYAQTRPWTEPWVFAHMCMVSPLTSGVFNFWPAQPVTSNRIQALAGHYPL